MTKGSFASEEESLRDSSRQSRRLISDRRDQEGKGAPPQECTRTFLATLPFPLRDSSRKRLDYL